MASVLFKKWLNQNVFLRSDLHQVQVPKRRSHLFDEKTATRTEEESEFEG
jgi:hypothetical protein